MKWRKRCEKCVELFSGVVCGVPGCDFYDGGGGGELPCELPVCVKCRTGRSWPVTMNDPVVAKLTEMFPPRYGLHDARCVAMAPKCGHSMNRQCSRDSGHEGPHAAYYYCLEVAKEKRLKGNPVMRVWEE